MIHFELDDRQLADLVAELGLTENQAKAALNRALRRTAGTLRRRAERELKSDLDIRKVAYLRRRLKDVRLTRNGLEGVKLWFGENDMPVSALRGSIRKTKAGAKFSGKAGTKEFDNGFVHRGRYGRTILYRRGAARLPVDEARVPVKAQMDALIEGQLFADTLDILWKYFEADMKARAKYGVGSAR